MVEFGRMMMVQQILTNGAREGARKALLPGITDAEAYQVIDSYLAKSGISGHTRQISPSATYAEAGTPLEVTVSVPYDKVSWLPLGAVKFLQGKTLNARVQMRKDEY